MNINLFLQTLAANPSRNFKIEQLKGVQNDATLREVVRLALDPFTQFYIRKIPKYEPICEGGTSLGLDWAINQLFSLSNRDLTGHAGIAHLTTTLSLLSADDAKVVERIIDKSLDSGFSISTANTVWPGLIKEYPVMLCSQYEEKLINKISWPAMVQLKMDGMRFNAIVRDDKVEFRSRNGKEIFLLGNLEEEFSRLAVGCDCVFDGELLVMIDGKIADRQTGNGILNRANKGTISEADAANVHAVIWDYIPYAYFTDGYCPLEYNKRFERIKGTDCVFPKIHVVEYQDVNNLEEANVIFNKYLSEGQEGIILKSKTGIWEDKRSKSQIKFKAELECDLKIVGIEEGTGKYQGMLGALVCETSDGILKTNVGSGFSDAQRIEFFDVGFIGKITSVKYNARITNKDGGLSLFLPIFIEIREDKDVADTNDVVK